jgi:hypothetical protein
MNFKEWLIFYEKKVSPPLHREVDNWLKSVENLKKELETLKDVVSKHQKAKKTLPDKKKSEKKDKEFLVKPRGKPELEDKDKPDEEDNIEPEKSDRNQENILLKK